MLNVEQVIHLSESMLSLFADLLKSPVVSRGSKSKIIDCV